MLCFGSDKIGFLLLNDSFPYISSLFELYPCVCNQLDVIIISTMICLHINIFGVLWLLFTSSVRRRPDFGPY